MKRFGLILGWMLAMMVLLVCLTVITRYVLKYVSIPIQELALYLHACAFMLGLIYAGFHDRHVRVDVFYQHWSPERKTRVNRLGHLLLGLPMMGFILYTTWPYVMRAWSHWEGSASTGGLPLVWLLKTLLILMPAGMIILLLWQLIFGPKKA